MQNKSDFKILAIDDDKDILLLLKYNLESEGYYVETASSGKKGISIAQKINPNLMLVDIMMPEMDGIQTCIKLREIDNLKSSYILFLTARTEEYSEVAAFDAGADDYITKPIKPRALLSRINSAQKSSRFYWLCDVVICASIEGSDFRVLFSSSCEEKNIR